MQAVGCDARMKILLVGHACSPVRGTEHAIAWNWAWNLSQRHQVWIITHPQERRAVEEFLAVHPNENLRFVWAALPGWLDPWDPAKGGHLRILLHYMWWQKAALRKALRLHQDVGFDVVHHVSWGTVSEPSPLWRMPIPFVWGPLGGGQLSPRAFWTYLGAARRGERVRALRMALLPYRRRLRKTIRHSALILSTNAETDEILKRAGARQVVRFLDTGLKRDFVLSQPPVRETGPPLTLLWVGQLEPRKCLPLALEAMAQTKDLPVRLLVAGRGSLREPWQKQAEDLGIGERVRFLGEVPYLEMPNLYRSADAFIFTSLRDAFGSQVLEATAAGLPVISLDHQGVGACLPADAGIKVPVTNPTDTVSGLAEAIRLLSCDADTRMKMGRAAWEFAQTQTGAHRAEVMTRLYEQLLGKGASRRARDAELVLVSDGS